MLIILSLVLLLAAMPLFAACGDDDDDEDIDIAPPVTSTQPPATSTGKDCLTVDNTLQELYDNPDTWAVFVNVLGEDLAGRTESMLEALGTMPMVDLFGMSESMTPEMQEEIIAGLAAVCEAGPSATSQPPAAAGVTVDSTIGEILDAPGGEAVLRECLGDEAVDNPQLSMAFGMNLATIAPMSGGVITDEMVACVDEGLQALASGETGEPPAATTEPVGPCLTIDSKLGDLLDNPDARAILEKHLPPDIYAKAGMVRGFALPVLAPQSDQVTDEMLDAIAADLEALGTCPTTPEPIGECLNIDSNLGDLLDNPDARAILEKHLPPDIYAKAGMVRGFSLPVLAPQSDQVTDEMLDAIAADLEALGACSTAPATTTTTAPTTTPSKLTGEPVKIGAMCSWSGPTALAGALLEQCIDVADYLLEQRGGILGGRPVDWILYDTEGDIARAQSGVQKLAADDVLAIAIGGVTAGGINSVVQLTTELRIPCFSVATWTKLPEYPYAVRTGSVINTERALLCGEYMLENFDPDTVAFLGENTDDCHDSIAAAKDFFQDAGVEIVYEQYIAYDTLDMTPYLTNIKAERPDVVITFLANATSCLNLYKQITGLGGWGDTKYMSISSHGANAVAEAGAQDTYFWSYWVPGLTCEGAKAFEKAWNTVEGDVPNSYHALEFTALWSAIEAIDQAGPGADRDDIADFIRSGTFSFEAPGGTCIVYPDGETNLRGFIAMIKDGKVILAP